MARYSTRIERTEEQVKAEIAAAFGFRPEEVTILSSSPHNFEVELPRELTGAEEMRLYEILTDLKQVRMKAQKAELDDLKARVEKLEKK